MWIAIAIVAVVVVAALVFGLVRYRSRRISLTRSDKNTGITEGATPTDRSGGYTAGSTITFSEGGAQAAPLPTVGDDAEIPRDAPRRTISNVQLPEPAAEPEPVEVSEPAETAEAAEAAVPGETVAEAAPEPEPEPEPEPAPKPEPILDDIAPVAGRLDRLRGRLASSQNAVGRGLLGLLGAGDLDEESWEEVEDTLLIADLGTAVTASIVDRLRSEMAARSVRTEAQARALLREVLIDELQPELDRSIKALPHNDKPSVLLIVGVNGTGKTTTVGKLARVLVADGRRVVLGAADTFRAAAADQLQAWGSASVRRWFGAPRVPTPPRSPSTPSMPVSGRAPTWWSSTPPVDCTPRPASWTSSARSSASWNAAQMSTRCCWYWTRPSGRTGWRRLGCSLTW
ncbi:SRP54-type, GTPase domain protein [Mycobacteroides abscessus MAB_030201_1061]|nr:SRP54-type, GTPase domain protein [Mycobacteroides abscessus MAB_030201_1061]